MLLVTIWEGPGSWWIDRWALYLCPWQLAPVATSLIELCVKVSLLDGQNIPLCQYSKVETPWCQATVGQSWLAITWLNYMDLVLAPFKHGNKIRTRILLRRGKHGIHMLLHISSSNIYRKLILLTRKTR